MVLVARSAGSRSRTRMSRSIGSIALFRGRKIRLWKHREIEGRFKSGNFSQDARGRWYCNIVCEVERQTTNRTHIVGIDLNHKMAAKCSDGPELPQARFYRDLEDKLAEAQRRGRKRQVQTIHAKIANRRKDGLHKFSRAVVNRAGAVFVGNISSTWQIASGAASSSRWRRTTAGRCTRAAPEPRPGEAHRSVVVVQAARERRATLGGGGSLLVEQPGGGGLEVSTSPIGGGDRAHGRPARPERPGAAADRPEPRQLQRGPVLQRPRRRASRSRRSPTT